MEVGKLSPPPAAPNARNIGTGNAGAARNDALAEKRRALTDEQIARADVSKARATERLAEVREAVARVLGANTRLSISRSETSFDFVYRAIDVDSGEIVNEWPRDKFVELVRVVRGDVRDDVDAGLILDRVA